MVVVGGPALAEHRIRARSVALVEERLAVHLDAAHVDAEVLLPLRDQVRAHRLVEGVRVVCVSKSLHFGPGRIPLLVLGHRRRGVEFDVVVRAVAEVAVEPLADRAARRLRAGGALIAHRIDQRLAVDRLAERVPPGTPFFDSREGT